MRLSHLLEESHQFKCYGDLAVPLAPHYVSQKRRHGAWPRLAPTTRRLRLQSIFAHVRSRVAAREVCR